MAKDTKTKLTNNADGARGIALAGGGMAILEPGETREVELSEAELDDLPEHFTVGRALSEAQKTAQAEKIEEEDRKEQSVADKAFNEQGPRTADTHTADETKAASKK